MVKSQKKIQILIADYVKIIPTKLGHLEELQQQQAYSYDLLLSPAQPTMIRNTDIFPSPPV